VCSQAGVSLPTTPNDAPAVRRTGGSMRRTGFHFKPARARARARPTSWGRVKSLYK